jgi:DNA polymerase-3 subunit gamma/tau
MSYLVLARKWRPKSFKTLVGQEHVVQALVNGLDQDRVHHAFLFTGTRGVGKTTIARILAKCLNCDRGVSSEPCGECSSCVDIDEGRFVDMIEINAADRTGVDETRDLLDSVQYTPSRGRFKVYIIDEVHMLSKNSFNALLKTLEEPPPHVKFLLATTNPEQIPITVLSRCLQFNLKRLLPDQIQGNLEKIVESEKIETEKEALTLLSRAADGSMRDGLSLLDQAIVYGGGQLTASHINQMLGLVNHEHITLIVNALAQTDATALLSIVEELVSQSRDIDHVLTSLAETFHRICLVQSAPGYSDAERTDWPAIQKLAETLPAEDAQLFYQIAIKGRQELGIAPDPRTGLEMVLLRMLAFRPADSGQDPSSSGQSELNIETAKAVETKKKPISAEPKPQAEVKPQSDNGLKAAPDSSEPSAAPPEKPQWQGLAFESPAKPAEATVTAQKQVAAAEPAPQAGDADWIALAKRLNLKGSVRELARNLHLQSTSQDQWEFVISRSLKHLGSTTSVDRLSQAISEQMGHPVTVLLVDGEETSLATAAKLEEQQLHTKISDAQRAIEEDPNIKSLKDQMGARIVEDSIQPLQ